MRKWPIGYDRKSRLYTIWRAIHLRHLPSHEAYSRYRDKGICKEWQTDYGAFMRWALTNGYADYMQIDRIDNSLGYSPSNCRWVIPHENARNRRDNLPSITAFGESKTPIEWSEDNRCTVSYTLLWKRLAAGWPIEIAIMTPSQARGKRLIGFNTGGYRPAGSVIIKEWRDR